MSVEAMIAQVQRRGQARAAAAGKVWCGYRDHGFRKPGSSCGKCARQARLCAEFWRLYDQTHPAPRGAR